MVAYINHQSGLRSQRLHIMAQDLHLWAQGRLASLRAAYVPGILNVAADMISKEGLPPWDWGLHPQVLQHLWDKFGRVQVNLFAFLDNAHCHLLYSMSEPPGPLGLDTLAHDWAFPPFPLIQAMLDRTRIAEHCLLLVAPYWPRQPWFSLIMFLLSGTP